MTLDLAGCTLNVESLASQRMSPYCERGVHLKGCDVTAALIMICIRNREQYKPSSRYGTFGINTTQELQATAEHGGDVPVCEFHHASRRDVTRQMQSWRWRTFDNIECPWLTKISCQNDERTVTCDRKCQGC